jgi:hypothetical protein
MLQAQDQLAQSETATATALVVVYKALGGGWLVSAIKSSARGVRNRPRQSWVISLQAHEQKLLEISYEAIISARADLSSRIIVSEIHATQSDGQISNILDYFSHPAR